MKFKSNLMLTFVCAGVFIFASCGDDFKGLSGFTIQGWLDNIMENKQLNPKEKVAHIFNESNPDLRRRGIEELSHHHIALRDPYLKAYALRANPASEKDPTVRSIAIRTLGKANDSKYNDVIIAALNDPNEMVRWDACEVYTHIGNNKALPILKQLAISDTSFDVRQTAAAALKHYNVDQVFDTLIKCLDDEKFEVRSAADKALAEIFGSDLGDTPAGWIHAKNNPDPENS